MSDNSLPARQWWLLTFGMIIAVLEAIFILAVIRSAAPAPRIPKFRIEKRNHTGKILSRAGSLIRSPKDALAQILPKDARVLGESTRDTAPVKEETGKRQFTQTSVIVKLKENAQPLSVNSNSLIGKLFTAPKPDIDLVPASVSDLNQGTVPKAIKEVDRKHKARVSQTLKGLKNKRAELEKIRKNFKTEVDNRERTIDEQKLLEKDLSKLYTLKFSSAVPVEDIVRELASDPDIEYAQTDDLIFKDYIPSDTHFSKQWALKNTGQSGGTPGADIKVEKAWDITRGSADVIIGVVDGGIDYTHPDLGGCLGAGCKVIAGYDFALNRPDPKDPEGHGTHVAGIIAASGNGQGISGICPNCRLVAAKIFDGETGSISVAIPAIQYAVEHGARILNNSWGAYVNSDALRDVISWATAQDVLFVAAAGNDNTSSLHYPSAYEDVFAVAATDNTDLKADYSNYGDYVDIAAPGGENDPTGNCRYFWQKGILSTVAHDGSFWSLVKGTTCGLEEGSGRYIGISGTSMASPQVAGLAGLVLSKNPTWNGKQLAKQIMYTADPLSDYAGLIGRGRINAYKALTSTEFGAEFFAGSPKINDASESWPNTVLEPGESPFVSIDLTNNSDTAFRNVSAVLTSGSPDLTVLQSASTYGDIAAGSLKTNSTEYRIRVGAGVKPGTKTNAFLKITYTDQAGVTKTTTEPVTFDVTADIGWPKKIDELWIPSTAYISDLNVDGRNEVIIQSISRVSAYTHDGHLLWYWGRPKKSIFTSDYMYDQMAVGNIDSDPYPEIVIPDHEFYFNHAALTVLDHNGRVKKEIPLSSGLLYETPVIAKLEEGGTPVIFASQLTRGSNGLSLSVKAIKSNGDVLWTWTAPEYTQEYQNFYNHNFSPPAVGDLDGDGKNEVLVSYYNFARQESRIVVLKATTGTPYITDIVIPKEMVFTPPVLGDVDGNGKLEIVFDAYNRTSITQYNHEKKIYVFNQNGSVLWGWPKVLGTRNDEFATVTTYHQKPVTSILADLNRDGKPEIITTLDTAVLGQDKVFAFRADASFMPNFPVPVNQTASLGTPDRPITGGLTAANIAGDENPEIILTKQPGIFAFAANGATVAEFTKSYAGIGVPYDTVAGRVGADATGSLLLVADPVSVVGTTVRPAADTDWPRYLHDNASTSNFNAFIPRVTPTPTPTVSPTPTLTVTPTVRPTGTPTPTPTGIIADGYSNLSSTTIPHLASFNFSYRGAALSHSIDVSTNPDMNWISYMDFAKGNSSPIFIINPEKWSYYKCGVTFWWKVRSASGSSKPQQAVVRCGPTPTPTKAPTATPTPTLPPVNPYGNYQATLNYPNAKFSFSYNGTYTIHYIDASTDPALPSNNQKSGWGYGYTSPITIANPTAWSGFTCGQKIYWRIRRQGLAGEPSAYSPTQNTTVSCPPTPTPTTVTNNPYTNVSADFRYPGPASFTFSYSGSPTEHTIDVSTKPDMSWISVFAWTAGTSSPLTVTNPTRWGGYTCGQKIYFRINNATARSTIYSATVTCGSTPTNTPSPRPPTPTPTRVPTPTPSPTLSPTPVPSASSEVRLEKIVIHKSQGYAAVTYSQTLTRYTYIAASTPFATVIIQGNGSFGQTPGAGTVITSLSNFLNPDYLVRGEPVKLCTGDYSVCSNEVRPVVE